MNTEAKGEVAQVVPDRADAKELIEEDAGKPLPQQAGVPEAEEGVKVELNKKQLAKRPRSEAQQASAAKAREAKRQKHLLKQQAPEPVVAIEQPVQQATGITHDHFNEFADKVHKRLDSVFEHLENFSKASDNRWDEFNKRQTPVPTKEVDVPIKPLEPMRGLMQDVDDYPKSYVTSSIRF